MKDMGRVFCNMCGKSIDKKNDILLEDVLSVKKVWGFFSSQDGIQYEFDLCESCCSRLLEGFQIPAVVTEEKELL